METTAQPADRRSDELGKRGEDLAADYLADTGLVLLSRNWRCRDGEVDLIATDGERLVICEVKTRSGSGYGEPAEAVTAAKAARIRRVAAQWLRTYRVGWCEIRFDIVAVMCPPDGPVTVEHLQGAF
ncbi:MAG: YraN family protein [Pseudonocardiaceae bacterium]